MILYTCYIRALYLYSLEFFDVDEFYGARSQIIFTDGVK